MNGDDDKAKPGASSGTGPSDSGTGSTTDTSTSGTPGPTSPSTTTGTADSGPTSPGTTPGTVDSGTTGPGATTVTVAAGGPAVTVKKDFSDEPPRVMPTAVVTPTTAPFSIEEHQERVRGKIAGSLVGLLALIVVASFAYIGWYKEFDPPLKGLLELLIAPVVALVGSATGFYFGGRGKS